MLAFACARADTFRWADGLGFLTGARCNLSGRDRGRANVPFLATAVPSVNLGNSNDRIFPQGRCRVDVVCRVLSRFYAITRVCQLSSWNHPEGGRNTHVRARFGVRNEASAGTGAISLQEGTVKGKELQIDEK